MNRTSLLGFAAAIVLLVGVSGAGQSRSSTRAPRHDAGFQIVETSLADLRTALSGGRVTSPELANWVAGAPTPMPGNFNAVGGFAFNPYDPRMDPREGTFDGRPALQTGGSSSGIGTAASFWAASVGTDTGGSVISPSNANMLVGIRPTIGRISRYGVIPITADHDTAGPMTRTVADAAIMLGALESSAPDPNDPATTTCTPPPGRDYTKFLKADALKGARIGIPRAFYYDRIALNGDAPGRPRGIGPTTGITAGRGGLNAAQATAMADAIAVLKRQGAIVVDPADVPSLAAKDPK